MNNFADYMSSNIYIGNKDWGSNNVCMWKSKKIKEENPYMDGKWRFNMFDTEYSSNLYNQIPATTNTFTQLMYQKSFLTDLFNGALKNENFKKLFVTTFMDIAGNIFDNEKVNSLIDELSVSYEEYATDTLKEIYNKTTYASEVTKIKTFFSSRYASIVKSMKTSLKLTGEIVELTVNNDSQYGSVTVGTVNTDGTYTGNYYTDYPVTVKAYAKDGYTVTGWKLSDGRTFEGSTAEIELAEAVTAEPIYSSQTAPETPVTSETTTVTEIEDEDIYYGDLTGDEAADLTDLTCLSLYLMNAMNLSEKHQKAADIDYNGIVDIADLAYFKQYVSKDSKISSCVKIGR